MFKISSFKFYAQLHSLQPPIGDLSIQAFFVFMITKALLNIIK